MGGTSSCSFDFLNIYICVFFSTIMVGVGIFTIGAECLS